MTSTSSGIELHTRSIDQGPTLVEFPPAASFGPRTLVDYEFVWLLRGSATCTIDTPGVHGGGSTSPPGNCCSHSPG